MRIQMKAVMAIVLCVAMTGSVAGSPTNKPVFEHDQDLGELFRQRGWLKTEKLLDGWYMLANDNVAVLVDVVKPRIMAVFVHGKFGTWRQLLYDTPWNSAMSNGVWGIVPAYQRTVQGQRVRFLPIKKGGVITEPEEVRFDPEGCSLEMVGLTFFSRDGKLSSATKGNWRIRLEGDALSIEVDYPEEAEGSQLLTHWYPEYTSCRKGQQMWPTALPYDKDVQTKLTGTVVLNDAKGRLPRLTIDPGAGGAIDLQAGRDTARGGAYRLHVQCIGGKSQRVTFVLVPNPVTLRINPQINAAAPQLVTVFANENMYAGEKPTLEADGKSIKASFKRTAPGRWDGSVVLPDGEHTLVARVGNAVSTRRIFALADPTEKIVRVADCLLKLQWKTPALDGLMPYSYWIKTLKPRLWHGGKEEAVCGSYMIRICHVLAAAAVLTDDAKYTDGLFKMIAAHVRVSHKFEDGSLMPPPDLREDGSLQPGCEGWPRPYNQFEAVKGLMDAYRVFQGRGDKKRADQCLEWACGFAKTLIGMQRPDGGLHYRYRFGTFQPCKPMGVFKTPMGFAVMDLADVMERRGLRLVDVGSEELRGIVRRQIDYARSLPKTSFKMLSGSEAMPNSSAWFASFALGRMLTRRAYPEDVRDDDRLAMEGAKLMVYHTVLYPDLAEFYMIPGNTEQYVIPEESSFHGLMHKGDMDDTNTAVLGLSLLRVYKDPIGLVMARYAMGARLTTSIFDNGAVCENEANVPGYKNKWTHVSYADVNSATIGYTGFQYATGQAGP